MCTARDSNSLAALSAIVAYVLLLFEELASLHVKKLWTSMHNSAYNCDFKNLIALLNSLGTLKIYHVIKTAN